MLAPGTLEGGLHLRVRPRWVHRLAVSTQGLSRRKPHSAGSSSCLSEKSLSLITKAEMVASLITYSLARTTNLTRSVHSRIVRTSGPKGKQADRVEPIETGGLHARDSSAMYLKHSSKTLNVVLTVTVYAACSEKQKQPQNKQAH